MNMALQSAAMHIWQEKLPESISFEVQIAEGDHLKDQVEEAPVDMAYRWGSLYMGEYLNQFQLIS